MSRLNVVNGMAMLRYIEENNIDLCGEVVPFNEAMCDGDATRDIFGGEFESVRCTVHGVGVEEYEDIVINPLHPLFSLEYDELHLFFDEDMFCQINLITLLGYLDMNAYEGDILLHIIDYDRQEKRAVVVKPQGFYQVYVDVLIDKRYPEIMLPEVMMEGVSKYLEYSREDNEIVEYIVARLGEVSDADLLTDLMDRFSSYGLGDVQFQRMIDMAKIDW